MNTVTYGFGEDGDPWILKTPSLTSEYRAWREPAANPPALVIQVGTTRLSYHLRCLDDLHALLRARGGWVELGNADEGKPVKDGTVEAWARAADNPVGATTACARAIAAVLQTTSRPFSNSWGALNSNTGRALTAYERSKDRRTCVRLLRAELAVQPMIVAPPNRTFRRPRPGPLLREETEVACRLVDSAFVQWRSALATCGASSIASARYPSGVRCISSL